MTRLGRFLSRDAHPFLQFIKYGMAGALATLVDVLVFYMLALLLIPALGAEDSVVKLFGIHVEPMTDAIRSQRYAVDKVVSFVFSNLTAYVANILWVFKPGRHSRWMELLMFYAVSGFSSAIGIGLGIVLINSFGLSTTVTYAVNAVVSLMINYVCRKYFIFKG